MKLFAPTNNWDQKSSESWWPLVGSIQTSSGVAITEDSALGLTAFACGLRVISETIGSLPCHLIERQDERTTRKATDQPLYGIVHDEPNGEQDAMQFFDSSLSWQVGWGDAFAEVERFAGKVVALWPIHPSRIPVSNIRRNGYDPTEIEVGEPGEIVYFVNNDDGGKTQIPSSSMLHVPGALSRNGITGRSLVKIGADSIGIAKATEQHAGAFFKNGANPNFALSTPHKVGKETAERLRQQWQSTFGGVRNHYKTVILEEDMKAEVLTISPQLAQMIESRQYGVVEVARLLRIPPYFLMDLTQGKYNNVESQGQDLVIYSLMPWIVRWEKAMQRQLLTADEKKKYRFKFNVMGLLRGDQAARSAFYKAGFDMGVFSPNDIREYEDLNPVEGGDQRFVPANNLVPLTTIGELAQANLERVQADTATVTAKPETNSDQTMADAGNGNVVPDGKQDVQATALNVAQIQALVQIVTLLGTDQLPPGGTKAMLQAAFPLMDESLIDTMVKDISAFVPETPPEPTKIDPVQPPPTVPATETPSEPDETVKDMRADLSRLLVLQETNQLTLQDVLKAVDKSESLPIAFRGEFAPVLDALKDVATVCREIVEKPPEITLEAIKTAVFEPIETGFDAMRQDAEQVRTAQAERDEQRDARTETAITHNSEMLSAMRDVLSANREVQLAEREVFIEKITDAAKSSGEIVVSAVDSLHKLPELIGTAVSDAIQPSIDAQKAVCDAIPLAIGEIRQDIQAIEIPQPVAPPPVDTSAAEALAIREAALAQHQAELDARLQAEREASQCVLGAALKVRLESLAEWESKALAKAVDRPKEFISWREKFYPRFAKQFASVMDDLAPFAAQIGVKLDLAADSERYAIASVNDLKTLDEYAADNWHDRLKDGTDTLRKNLWLERPAAFASEMVERGKQRFKESSHVA